MTVGGVSYTVICTYYFWKGEIKVFLNEIFIMKSKHSDGEGSARMTCLTLMKTLGFSKEELAEKLEHISFDGVYANTEDRIRGGGSLNLVRHVAEYLGLGSDSVLITMSH